MPMVYLAGNGFGGEVQGNFGTYVADSYGNFTVDTRDTPSMLALGMTYVTRESHSMTFPKAPAAASAAGIVASVGLSDGALTIAAQPDVLRQVEFVIGAGTSAISAGNLAVTYVGNDGITATENISLVLPANGGATVSLSRGVDTIASATVTGLVGGALPFIYAGTTNTLALNVTPDFSSFAVVREYDAGATVAVGTVNAAIGGIDPTTAPNGTVTYSFVYSFVAPTS